MSDEQGIKTINPPPMTDELYKAARPSTLPPPSLAPATEHAQSPAPSPTPPAPSPAPPAPSPAPQKEG